MLLSTILGTVTGIVGSGINGIFKIKDKKLQLEEKKLDQSHEIAMSRIDMEMRQKEAEHQIVLTETQIAGELEKTSGETFLESIKIGNKQNISSEALMMMMKGNGVTKFFGYLLAFLLGLIDVVRTGIRPAVTIVMMIVTGYITNSYIEVAMMDVELITAAQITMIINAIFYLTFTILGWWFGERGLGKAIGKIFNK